MGGNGLPPTVTSPTICFTPRAPRRSRGPAGTSGRAGAPGGGPPRGPPAPPPGGRAAPPPRPAAGADPGPLRRLALARAAPRPQAALPAVEGQRHARGGLDEDGS